MFDCILIKYIKIISKWYKNCSSSWHSVKFLKNSTIPKYQFKFLELVDLTHQLLINTFCFITYTDHFTLTLEELPI